MKKYIKKRITEQVVSDVICDKCHNTCSRGFKHKTFEYAVINADWGFNSKRDYEHNEFHICEECYDKLLKWLNTK